MIHSKKNTHLAFRALINQVIDSEEVSQSDTEFEMNSLLSSDDLKFILKNINGFILVFNYRTGLYDYISEGLIPNLGYRPYELTGQGGVNFLYSLIDPVH